MTWYDAIVLIICFTIGILMAIVAENARLTKEDKRIRYKTYAAILIATLAEWGGLALNNAPMQTAFLHSVVKAFDYIFSPLLAVFTIQQLYPEKRSDKWIVFPTCLNALLVIISVFTGWIFYIDETNVYRHGPLYAGYTLFFVYCIVYGLILFLRYGTRFRRRNRTSLILIFLLLFLGIFLQEAVSSDLRTCCLTMTIVSVLLSLHTHEFSQMQRDEDFEIKQQQLNTDPMTGLQSRFAYTTDIEQIDSEPGTLKNISVFSIDVNLLKSANDTMGHVAGDELICGASECIKRALGDYGCVYRTGGDEFIAILNADAAQTREAEKALIREAEAWHGSINETLSLSIGYVCAEEFPELKLEKLIAIADKRMYQDKSCFYSKSGIDRRRH